MPYGSILLQIVQSLSHFVDFDLHVRHVDLLQALLELDLLQPDLLPELWQEVEVYHEHDLQLLLAVLDQLFELAPQVLLRLPFKRRQHGFLIDPHQFDCVVAEVLACGQELGRDGEAVIGFEGHNDFVMFVFYSFRHILF